MEIVLRSVILYVFIWVLLRAMGRKELSQLTSFELILLIVMGDLIQQGVTQEDMSITGALLTVSTLAILTVGSSLVAYRFRRLRPLVGGVSVVIVRDGVPDGSALRMEQLTLDEVKEAARLQGISDLRDVRLGVLEADGKFSFLTGAAGEAEPSGEKEQPGPERA